MPTVGESLHAVETALRNLETACAALARREEEHQAQLAAGVQRLDALSEQLNAQCTAVGKEVGEERVRHLANIRKSADSSQRFEESIAEQCKGLKRGRWDALVKEAAEARLAAVWASADKHALRPEEAVPLDDEDPIRRLLELDQLCGLLSIGLEDLETGDEKFNSEHHLTWLKVSPGVAPLIRMLALPGVSRAHFAVEAAYRRGVMRACWSKAINVNHQIRVETDARVKEDEAWYDAHLKERVAEAHAAYSEQWDALKLELEADRERLIAEHAAGEEAAQAELRQLSQALDQSLGSLERQPAAAPWGASAWESWTPATEAAPEIRFGQCTDGFPRLRQQVLEYARLALPVLWSLTGDRPLLFSADAKGSGPEAALGMLVRLLASQPPGRVRFTVADPSRLGQSVAPLLPLLDLAPELLGGKILSDPQEIEKALAELINHIERVIQKCLRHEFADLAEYNAQAGEVAEPYRVLAVWDFPTGWTESSLRRLLAILRNGPRCGVQTILVANREAALPHGFTWQELRDLTTAPEERK